MLAIMFVEMAIASSMTQQSWNQAVRVNTGIQTRRFLTITKGEMVTTSANTTDLVSERIATHRPAIVCWPSQWAFRPRMVSAKMSAAHVPMRAAANAPW